MIGTYDNFSFFKGKVPVVSLKVANVTGRSMGDQREDLEHEEEAGIIEYLEDLPLIIKEFHISPSVTSVSAFIIGPPQFNMQPEEYMKIIPGLTNTDCVLKDRCIRIIERNTAWMMRLINLE